MRTVFADTGYWIALLDPQDTLHLKAIKISQDMGSSQIYTSDMVFTEVLNHFAKRGPFLKQAAISLVQAAQANGAIAIVAQNFDLFQRAFLLYQNRLDQSWGLTDCASFILMRDRNLQESLAYDKHFEQAGFIALLR